jgi:putative ABC transport system substrate-binding protein
MELTMAPVTDPAEIEPAIAAFERKGSGGLMSLPDTFMIVHRELVVRLASSYRLPAVYPLRIFATAGGLIVYGVDVPDLSRRAAAYVDRILKGAKASELPVQQPVKFEFVLNLKAAKALGLEIPPGVLALADEVIE